MRATPQVGGSPVGVRSSPPVNRLKGPWSVSRRFPVPRWFVGDPISLALDNTFGQLALQVFNHKEIQYMQIEQSIAQGPRFLIFTDLFATKHKSV